MFKHQHNKECISIDMGFKKYINEGINDKNVFKAVILAGGPGSGKSFIGTKLFGGVAKFVASDIAFELLLKKSGLSTVLDIDNKEQFEKQSQQRKKAKDLTTKQLYNFIDGMLPIVIDGTGKDLNKIKQQQQELTKIGYDVSLVFINTDLEIALKRNRERSRSLSDSVVTELWKKVQQNIGAFQSLFGSNFKIIDNNDVLDNVGLKKLQSTLGKISIKLLDSQLKNRLGISILKRLKDIGGKTLSDLLTIDKNLRI